MFRPDRPEAEPFTIVIPPPNVTGSLHIGHALDITLQDVLVRHARLQGKDALWVVGTDHAGIATQMVVERTIAGQGLTRQSLGREKFLDIVWDWKATSGGAITRQLRRLGASCDWANERFTMDPGFSAAVIKVFVQLHREGLIYRDKRLVNWDPQFQTAISDLEVESPRRNRASSGTSNIRSRTAAVSSMSPRPGRRRCSPTWRSRSTRSDERYAAQVGKKIRHADHRPADPVDRRRACRSRARLGRGQDHAGSRFQRFRGGPAAPAGRRRTCSTCSMPRRGWCRRRTG